MIPSEDIGRYRAAKVRSDLGPDFDLGSSPPEPGPQACSAAFVTRTETKDEAQRGQNSQSWHGCITRPIPRQQFTVKAEAAAMETLEIDLGVQAIKIAFVIQKVFIKHECPQTHHRL